MKAIYAQISITRLWIPEIYISGLNNQDKMTVRRDKVDGTRIIRGCRENCHVSDHPTLTKTVDPNGDEAKESGNSFQHFTTHTTYL